MIKRVDLLNGVMMAFKRVLLVNFWVECMVVLPIGSMVGCRYLFLLFTMNSFICAAKKTKNTMSYCVIHEKNGDKTKVN